MSRRRRNEKKDDRAEEKNSDDCRHKSIFTQDPELSLSLSRFLVHGKGTHQATIHNVRCAEEPNETRYWMKQQQQQILRQNRWTVRARAQLKHSRLILIFSILRFRLFFCISFWTYWLCDTSLFPANIVWAVNNGNQIYFLCTSERCLCLRSSFSFVALCIEAYCDRLKRTLDAQKRYDGRSRSVCTFVCVWQRKEEKIWRT